MRNRCGQKCRRLRFMEIELAGMPRRHLSIWGGNFVVAGVLLVDSEAGVPILSSHERRGSIRSRVRADLTGCVVAGRYNEGKAIDAVLRRIEERDRCSRHDDGWSPDDLKDPDPQRRVDYVCTVGDRLYAFEHTGIEPFGNQIEMEVRNRALFGPIIERFSKRSDGEFWELYFPVDAPLGLRGREVKHVSDALIRWIETNASNMRLTRYGDRLASPLLSETATSVPFRFSLYRWTFTDMFPHGQSPLSNHFDVRPFVERDLEPV
jgi:hypothetical protein